MIKTTASSGQPAMVDPLNDRPRLPEQRDYLRTRPVDTPRKTLSLWRRG